MGLVLRVAAEIIGEALRFQVPLRNDLNIACRKAFAVVANPLTDLRQQQRIVGAAENEGVDERILL